jgi:multidrug efflux pump subunit AcrB/outer membrane protein TolC
MNVNHIFSQQSRLIIVAALLLSISGILSWTSMPKEEDPRFPDRYAAVSVIYPGADADTIERTVVLPLEEELQSLTEIATIEATARTDIAVLTLTLEDTITEVDSVWAKVQTALDRAARRFPAGTGTPELDSQVNDTEAITIAVTGSGDWSVLHAAADELERRLRRIPTMKRVARTPDIEPQITVEIDEARIRELGTSVSEVVHKVSGLTGISPGGAIAAGGSLLSVDTRTAVASADELARTTVSFGSGAALQLGSVARVSLDEPQPVRHRARFNGASAIIVGAVPRADIDTISFGRLVLDAVEEARLAVPEVDLSVMTFQPAFVQNRLRELSNALLQGVAIVAAIVIVAMGVRVGLTVALMVPVVALASLSVYAFAGGVLHQISAAALVMSLGLLVDNAIVVAERIQTQIDAGMTRANAAEDAVRSLAVPLAAATGTTLAAYLPMLLARGETAEFTAAIPRLVMLTIAMSFVFALIVTPTLAMLLFRPSSARSHSGATAGRRTYRIGRFVGRFVTARPGTIVLVAVVAVGFSFAVAGRVPLQFFPAGDRAQIVFDIELPEGSHLEETDRYALGFERALFSRPEVTSVATFVGNGVPRFYYNVFGQSNAPHFAQFLVATRSPSDIAPLAEWAREYAQEAMSGIVFVPRPIEQGPPLSAPIAIRLQADDLGILEAAAERTTAIVRRAAGTVDVRHDLSTGSAGIAVSLRDSVAGGLGVSRSDVATAVLARTRGLPAGELRLAGNVVPVVVRSGPGEWTDAPRLSTVSVSPSLGAESVPLVAVADTEISLRPSAIRRRNGSRVATVSAGLRTGAAYNEVLAAIMPAIASEGTLPEGVSVQLGGADEGAGNANRAIAAGATIGVGALLLILLAQFRSFIRLGLVLLTVPLAAVGIIPGLLLAGQPFGFMSMLGVISLVGIVVNNAIILLDVIDGKRRDGADISTAVTEGIEQRVRPIVLTSVTTIAGLLPLLFSPASLWPPFASALISGLAASTALTILVVPAAYLLCFRRSDDHGGNGGGAMPVVTAAAAILLLFAAPTASHAQNGVPLAQLLEAARTAPPARAAQAEATAARYAAVAVSRGATLPTVSFQSELVRRTDALSSDTPFGSVEQVPLWDGSVAAVIRQPLLNIAEQTSGVRVAREQARAKTLDAEWQVEQHIYEASESVLDLSALAAQAEAARVSAEALRTQRERVAALVESGRLLESELLLIDAAVLEVERDLRTLERAAAVSRLAVERAVGISVQEGVLVPDIDPEQIENMVQREAGRSVGARADIAALSAQRAALEASRSGLERELLPAVSLEGRAIHSLNTDLTPELWGELSIQAVWTPLASGVRRARHQELSQRVNQVSQQTEDLRAAARIQVASARSRLEGAVDSAAVAQQLMEARGAIVAERTVQFEAGRSTVSELIEAEAALRRATTEAEIARLEIVSAYLEVRLRDGLRVEIAGIDQL